MYGGEAPIMTAFDIHVLFHPEEDTVNRRILSGRLLSVATLIATVVFGGGLTPSAAHAATYYTAKTGSDNNSCASAQSTSTPKLTIQSGISCLKAGDTLYIRAGTYGEAIRNPPSGTSWNAPVTIAAYSGESVILKAANTSAILALTYTGSLIQYIIFDRLVFDGNNVSTFAVNLNGTNWSGNNVNRIRFRNVEVKNATASGVLTGQGVHFLEFIGGSYHHNGRNAGDHGIYLESSDCLIEGGTFYNNSGFGIHIYNGYAGQSNNRNVVRKNIVYGNYSGIILGSGDGNTAYNNLVYNNRLDAAEYGLGYGIGVGFNATNTKVYNNTVYGNLGDGIQIRSASSGTVVQNNIVYSNTTSLANYATGSTTLSNNLTTDPGFVNATSADFHLKLGSAAIDKGITLSAVADDHEGKPRPGGASYDIGAHEYTTSTALSPPSAPMTLQVSVQ
jgi:parallel beta-helix repeat protein